MVIELSLIAAKKQDSSESAFHFVDRTALRGRRKGCSRNLSAGLSLSTAKTAAIVPLFRLQAIPIHPQASSLEDFGAGNTWAFCCCNNSPLSRNSGRNFMLTGPSLIFRQLMRVEQISSAVENCGR
jgi:hypothetical protein